MGLRVDMSRHSLCIRHFKRGFLSLGSNSNTEQFHTISKKVSVPPHLLFQIVSDVDKYKQFVPFVTESFISCRDAATKLPTEAGLRVGWKHYDEKFSCQLTCERDKRVMARSISILLFENLYNEWKFKEVKSRFTSELSTLVEVVLKYKFKNPIYNTVASLFHDQVSQIMINAFEKRAMELKIQEKFKDRTN